MTTTTERAMVGEMRKVLHRLHYPLEVRLVCARWYAVDLLSFRHLEEMMQERGVFVDHSSVHRWILKFCRSWRSPFAVASVLLGRVG